MVMKNLFLHRTAVGLTLGALVISGTQADPVQGWLNWRGPERTGMSRETGLPDKVDPKHPLWLADFPVNPPPSSPMASSTSWAISARARTCRKGSVLRRRDGQETLAADV